MKIYSEKLNKLFDTIEEATKAEEAYDTKVKLEAEERAKKDAERSTDKKKLADDVEMTKTEYYKACKESDIIKEDAYKVVSEAKAKAQKMINDQSAVVKEKAEAYYKAVEAFNKKYGPYKTTYSAEDALDEYRKSLAIFNQFFNLF